MKFFASPEAAELSGIASACLSLGLGILARCRKFLIADQPGTPAVTGQDCSALLYRPNVSRIFQSRFSNARKFRRLDEPKNFPIFTYPGFLSFVLLLLFLSSTSLAQESADE